MALAHTTRVFDFDLQQLARAIAEMGGLAEWQTCMAIEALTTRDDGLAWRVVAADTTIDAMQHSIEERAIETIVRRQPVAGDLRQIISILRIAAEIERTGDLAKNISKRIIAIHGEDLPQRSIRGMSHLATLMLTQLHDVLDAFATSNVGLAIDVWTRDQDVDRLCTSLFRDLLGRMMENSIKMSLGTHLLFCTKNFERMGDHATNIAEAVHYMVIGETLSRERPKADLTSTLSVVHAGAVESARLRCAIEHI